MAKDMPKVVVAMSGGVDSSVAACLLHEQGYDVMGLFMRVGAEVPAESGDGRRNHQGCCSAADAADARFVAGKLGIPFFALNFAAEFDSLIDYFAAEYAAGRTPNPCVMCNQKFKFGKIMDYADAVGARYVATGHYARIQRRDDRTVLRKAVDDRKDQSYVLFGLRPRILDRVLFPIGGLTKDQVRDEARRFDLPVSDKPDSVEICFVPDRDYARIVRERRPDAFADGDVVNEAGEVLGRHRGIGHFTIGQRRGLGIAAGVPIYVTQIETATNTVTVGERDRLMKRGLVAQRVSLMQPDTGDEFRADVKIRYLHRAAPATVTLGPDATARVIFDEPQCALTPGQAVVFYAGETVIGGGWIVEAIESLDSPGPQGADSLPLPRAGVRPSRAAANTSAN